MSFVEVPTTQWKPFAQWAKLIGQPQATNVVPSELFTLFKSTVSRIRQIQSVGAGPVLRQNQRGMHLWWVRNDPMGRFAWDKTNFGAAYQGSATKTVLESAPTRLIREFNALVSKIVSSTGAVPATAALDAGSARLSDADKYRVFGLLAKTTSKAAPVISDPLATPFDKTPTKTVTTGTKIGADSTVRLPSIFGGGGFLPGSPEEPGDPGDLEIDYYPDLPPFDVGGPPVRDYGKIFLVGAVLVGGYMLLKRGKR